MGEKTQLIDISRNIFKSFDDKSFSYYMKLGALVELIPLMATLNLNFFFNFYFFISWMLITLQYCSGFCHTLK